MCPADSAASFAAAVDAAAVLPLNRIGFGRCISSAFSTLIALPASLLLLLPPCR
jgi:hypothetical protein